MRPDKSWRKPSESPIEGKEATSQRPPNAPETTRTSDLWFRRTVPRLFSCCPNLIEIGTGLFAFNRLCSNRYQSIQTQIDTSPYKHVQLHLYRCVWKIGQNVANPKPDSKPILRFAARKLELLATRYFHVCFSLPHQLKFAKGRIVQSLRSSGRFFVQFVGAVSSIGKGTNQIHGDTVIVAETGKKLPL
jgi:hypothetical protein